MAEGQDPIVIDVEFEGGQQAARGLSSVTAGLSQMDQAADAAASSTQQATASWSQMAQVMVIFYKAPTRREPRLASRSRTR